MFLVSIPFYNADSWRESFCGIDVFICLFRMKMPSEAGFALISQASSFFREPARFVPNFGAAVKDVRTKMFPSTDVLANNHKTGITRQDLAHIQVENL